MAAQLPCDDVKMWFSTSWHQNMKILVPGSDHHLISWPPGSLKYPRWRKLSQESETFEPAGSCRCQPAPVPVGSVRASPGQSQTTTWWSGVSGSSLSFPIRQKVMRVTRKWKKATRSGVRWCNGTPQCPSFQVGHSVRNVTVRDAVGACQWSKLTFETRSLVITTNTTHHIPIPGTAVSLMHSGMEITGTI